MTLTSSILHSLKDQIRTVKYSIRAEAEVAGSMLPRALQRREVRRFTTLGSVVSMPAFRLVDGIVTRVETIAMDLLGGATGTDSGSPAPIAGYLGDSFEFTDKLFQLLKGIVGLKGARTAFVSEQALDAAWTTVSKALEPLGSGSDPVYACAVVAHALALANPVRRAGFQPGGEDTPFGQAPNLYCGMLAGLVIAVATCRPEAAADGDGFIESIDSAVNARFDRFRRAFASEAPIEAIATEYRKLIPFLP